LPTFGVDDAPLRLGEQSGQEHVLAIEITRAGLECALTHACLSHHDATRHRDRQAWTQRLRATPVRAQWDPERSLQLGALPYRSLQVGLSGEAAAMLLPHR
jgi:hypothetical protein